jgi:hypothetical protein
MELQEFIQKAIADIAAAVDAVNTSSTRRVTFKKHEGKRTVEFDIAVTAESASTGKAGAGIKVLSLIDVGGSNTKEVKNSVVSRIVVGIDLDENTYAEDQAQAIKAQERRATHTNYLRNSAI